MAYVTIEYDNLSFDENPVLITWVQKFLLRCLENELERPNWTYTLEEEWEINIEIDVYKYFFDPEMLDSPQKKEWIIMFLDKQIEILESMDIPKFALLIEEIISSSINFNRIKMVVINIRRMILGLTPL